MEIKLCPNVKCRSKNISIVDYGDGNYQHRWLISCKDCSCTSLKSYEKKKDAIKEWNNRPESAQAYKIHELKIRISEFENGLLEIRKIIENCKVDSAERGMKLLGYISDKTIKLSYPEWGKEKEQINETEGN